MKKKDALKGGMPFYKLVGNIILTTIQNFLLKTKLAEFHTGYRIYSINSLKNIPFHLNTNDFHFDTEILIQLFIAFNPWVGILSISSLNDLAPISLAICSVYFITKNQIRLSTWIRAWSLVFFKCT